MPAVHYERLGKSRPKGLHDEAPVSVLGSFVAWPAFLLLVPLYIVRLLDEESLLRRELPGYPEYCLHTPFRLLPHLW